LTVNPIHPPTFSSLSGTSVFVLFSPEDGLSIPPPFPISRSVNKPEAAAHNPPELDDKSAV
jgi:hypothetical protein